MDTSLKYNKLHVAFVLGVYLILLAGCSVMPEARKSLEQGDFVPDEALATTDFLNGYEHHLPSPKHQMVDIDIALERSAMMATGDDKIYAQVALTTKKPSIRASNIHVLFYNPPGTSEQNMSSMKKVLASVSKFRSELPAGSSLTVDWGADNNSEAGIPSLLNRGDKEKGLVRFLRSFSRLSLKGEKHHFILVLGDKAEISHDLKQNVVDIGNILQSKSYTLSVLSVADRPDYAFLRKLSENGKGTFNVTTSEFDYKNWLENEIRFIAAEGIKNIAVKISAKDGLLIREIKSPYGLTPNQNHIEQHVKSLTQGKQYAMVLELCVSDKVKNHRKGTVNVEVEYFDVKNMRYTKIKKTGEVNFVKDRNRTLAKNRKVTRSMLILDTHKTMKDITPVIRDKRYYQAVAMLTQQRVRLEQYGKKYNDKELLRDAGILKLYSEKLYDFDETIFQSFKIWDDFSLDTGRYTESFQ